MLVWLRKRKPPDGSFKKPSHARSTNAAIRFNEEAVGWRARPIVLEKELQAAIVDDTLGAMNGHHGLVGLWKACRILACRLESGENCVACRVKTWRLRDHAVCRRGRPNTEISGEDRAMLAIAGFVRFISLLDGPLRHCLSDSARPPSDGDNHGR